MGRIQNEVIVRDMEGNYLSVPVDYLYIKEEENEINKELKHSIKSISREGNKVTVTFHISYIKIPIDVGKRNLSQVMVESLGYTNMELEEFFKIIRDENIEIRYKTRTGIYMEVVCEIDTRGKVVVDQRQVRIINPITKDIEPLPNMYDNGEICWGYITLGEYNRIEECSDIFFKFMGTGFNLDLSRCNYENNKSMLKWIDEKKRILAEEDSDISKVKRIFLDKVLDKGIRNVYILLIMSSLFDEDNVNISSKVC